MTKAYSVAEREAAIAAVDAGQDVRSVAAKVGSSPGTIVRWRRARDAGAGTGHRSGGAMPKLTALELAVLKELVVSAPGAAWTQFASDFAAQTGRRLSRAALLDALGRKGFRQVPVPRRPLADGDAAAHSGRRYRDEHLYASP